MSATVHAFEDLNDGCTTCGALLGEDVACVEPSPFTVECDRCAELGWPVVRGAYATVEDAETRAMEHRIRCGLVLHQTRVVHTEPVSNRDEFGPVFYDVDGNEYRAEPHPADVQDQCPQPSEPEPTA